MRSWIVGFVCGFAALGMDSAPGMAQAVALPLRGDGELATEDTVRDVEQGSVLLQADRTVKIVFIEAGLPRTVLAGEWRMANRSTAELAVHEVLGRAPASGAGEIRFRPDGSVGHLGARGRAAGREFTLEFDNVASVARTRGEPPADSGRFETGARPPRSRDRQSPGDLFPWGGDWAVVDVSRHGEGRLKDAMGAELGFDRARLTLGDNDEFLLVLDGDERVELAGVWEGDPRDSPVRLQLRERMGEKLGGVGRAWLRERSWDRDWSLERVELDGWDDEAGDAFTLYFEAGRPPDSGPPG
jgi:hypothetical protein